MEYLYYFGVCLFGIVFFWLGYWMKGAVEEKARGGEVPFTLLLFTILFSIVSLIAFIVEATKLF